MKTAPISREAIRPVRPDMAGTPSVADKALEEVPDQIVEQQTSEVDAVTSATLTSEAIKAAVADCIRQAKQG